MDYFDHIETYLQGELSEVQREAFEKAMQADPALAQAVAQQQQLLDRLEAMRLRQQVARAVSSNTPASQWQLRWWLLTGIVGLAFFLGLWWWSRRPQQQPAPMPAPADLPIATADTADQIQPVTPTPDPLPNYRQLAISQLSGPQASAFRGAGPAQEAAAAFEQGDYRKVFSLLKEPAPDTDPEQIAFVKACTHFKTGDFVQAARYFQQLDNSFQFKFDAQWNRALCDLAQGKTRKARQALQQIAHDPEAPFHAKATKLLLELGKAQ